VEEQSQAPADTGKMPYAPPKATFVPLQSMERLLACGKILLELQVSCGGVPSLS
jgi:hypothetical protein